MEYLSNSYDEPVSITLEMEVDTSKLRLDEKQVFDHYTHLTKCGITSPFLVRLINFFYLLFIIMLFVMILIMSAMFLEIASTYLYDAFADNGTYDAYVNSELGADILFSMICYIISFALLLLTLASAYWSRHNLAIRLLYIRNAKKIMHFAPGFAPTHESSQII
jgi:hypothetical protein